MAKIFISYKRVDKEKVFLIVDRIQNDLNETCWMDIDEIESDAQFASVIINAIDEASVFLFMYSKAHTIIDNYATDWTIRELNYAQERKKRIVFINIDDIPLSNWFIFMFPQKQQVRAKTESEIEKLIRDLSHWLKIKEGQTIKRVNEGKGPSPHTTPQSSVRLSQNNDDKNTHLDYTVLGVPFSMIKVTDRTFLGETPVTQLLWCAIMQDNPSRFKGESHPVDSVSWNDCQLFINRVNNLTKMHFRLPTEDEWEYAALGGSQSRNFLYSGSNILDEVAWNLENSENTTHPVKQKKANELGLYDMSGNVWEWCEDEIEEFVDMSQLLAGQIPRMFRIYKGGCWCETENCKPTAHKAGPPNFKSHGGLGLRLALTKDDVGLNNYHCKLTLLHKDSVESALFSPNGKLIASASDDNTLCIWDAENGNHLTRLKGHNDFVTCVAFNSDGNCIVSASDDGTIRTWDVKSGSCLQILIGHEDSIWSASFSPDGKIIVSASVDNTIRIWNLTTGNCIKTLYGHVRDVNHACFSPDGQSIVSASEDGTIRIWDSNLGSCMQVLYGHNDGVWHAKYSLDGKHIVSASADCTIRIWDAKNGNCIKVLEGHDDDVNSASFSSDGKYIVSASDDNTIRVWDALTGNCIQILKGHNNFVNSAFFSPNDKQIVSASDDHTIIIWEKNY